MRLSTQSQSNQGALQSPGHCLMPNAIQNARLLLVGLEGDVMHYSKLKVAIKGQDIVYVNHVSNLEAMAKNIIKVMQETGVKRIIAISSIGIYKTPLQSIVVPYRKLADII